ncbi:MAG TPA: DUF4160 domain-containing protein [Thermoanaerobaculia bacterium]
MPTISRFYGIVIRMYRGDHPPPHFHAYYAEFHATLAIETLELLSGRLPPRSMAMVLEWAMHRRPQLVDNWRRCLRHEPALPIAGLDEEA